LSHKYKQHGIDKRAENLVPNVDNKQNPLVLQKGRLKNLKVHGSEKGYDIF
jgi:hypothetical protein